MTPPRGLSIDITFDETVLSSCIRDEWTFSAAAAAERGVSIPRGDARGEFRGDARGDPEEGVLVTLSFAGAAFRLRFGT